MPTPKIAALMKRLCDCTREAVPVAELKQVTLFQLGDYLEMLVKPGAGGDIVFDLVSLAEQKGQLLALAQGLADIRPGRPEFAQLVVEITVALQAGGVAAAQTIAAVWPQADENYDWPLADRRMEFALGKQILAGATTERILLVCGDSNSGKTSFLNQFVAYARHLKIAAARIDLKGCPTVDRVCDLLQLDLGETILPGTFQAEAGRRRLPLVKDLQRTSIPVLLVFDTFEKATDEIRDWLEIEFLERVGGTAGVVTLVAGQELPNHKKSTWETLAKDCCLEPIHSIDDWLDYNHRRWPGRVLKREHIEVLTVSNRGSPGNICSCLESAVEHFHPVPSQAVGR